MVRIEHVLDSWKTVRKDTVAAVRDFPPEAFAEKLIEGVDPFGTIATHILNIGHAFPALLISGYDNLLAPDWREKLRTYFYVTPGETMSPDKLAEALEQSIEARCSELSRQTPGFFAQEITRFDGTRLTRLEMISFVKEHELTHRSQLFMLMRLKGLVPATTRRRLAAAK